MILFLIATSLQFLTTVAFFIFYNKNPLPANVAESRRQSVVNQNGKSSFLIWFRKPQTEVENYFRRCSPKHVAKYLVQSQKAD